jgi:hypothetical protein
MAPAQAEVSLWLGGLVGAGLFATTVVVSLVPLCHSDGGAQMDAKALSRDLGSLERRPEELWMGLFGIQ